jgi:hypothetical protein
MDKPKTDKPKDYLTIGKEIQSRIDTIEKIQNYRNLYSDSSNQAFFDDLLENLKNLLAEYIQAN